MKAHSGAWRVAVEVIYEDGGHSEICFSGFDEAELAHVNADIHGGKGAHVELRSRLGNPRSQWRAVRIRSRLRYMSLLVANLMGTLQGACEFY